jgi:hypothetical protein
LPMIEALKRDSAPRSLIMGVVGLWFHLTPDRALLQDSNFGCLTGRKPDLIVKEPLFTAFHQVPVVQAHIPNADGLECLTSTTCFAGWLRCGTARKRPLC